MRTEAQLEKNRTYMANRRLNEEFREQNRAYSRAYGASHREERRAYIKKFRLKRDYGITIEQFNEMLASQHGKCAICEVIMDPPARATRDSVAVTVDHCHQSGKVRGLLCYSCNLGLGIFKDRVERLEAAVKYLRKDELVAVARKDARAEGVIEGRGDASRAP